MTMTPSPLIWRPLFRYIVFGIYILIGGLLSALGIIFLSSPLAVLVLIGIGEIGRFLSFGMRFNSTASMGYRKDIFIKPVAIIVALLIMVSTVLFLELICQLDSYTVCQRNLWILGSFVGGWIFFWYLLQNLMIWFSRNRIRRR